MSASWATRLSGSIYEGRPLKLGLVAKNILVDYHDGCVYLITCIEEEEIFSENGHPEPKGDEGLCDTGRESPARLRPGRAHPALLQR